MTKRKVTVTATSPAAMGKALVLLATSCAALSTGGGGNHHGSITTRSAPSNSRSHHGHCKFRSSTVALRYRDGDEDQTVDMRRANQRALTAAGGVTGEKEATVSTPTSSERVPMAITMPHFTITLPRLPVLGIRLTMPSMPSHPPPSKEDEAQLVMDEYLESVERRYSRMHPRRRPPRRPKQHSALDLHVFLSTLLLHRLPTLTLAAPPPSAQDSPALPQEDEEDPLNVLGLSSFASARLQRRLHAPRDLRDEVNFLSQYRIRLPNKNKGNRSAASLSPASPPALARRPAATAGGRLSSNASLSFLAQLRLLGLALRRLARTFACAVRLLAVVARRTVAEVAARGGSQWSARALVSASALLLVLFRPLFEGAWKSASA